MKKQSQNKANLLDAQMNISSLLTKDYENEPRFQTPGKQTQSNPTCSELVEPISKAKKMLLHLTINGRRKSFGYYAAAGGGKK